MRLTTNDKYNVIRELLPSNAFHRNWYKRLEYLKTTEVLNDIMYNRLMNLYNNSENPNTFILFINLLHKALFNKK